MMKNGRGEPRIMRAGARQAARIRAESTSLGSELNPWLWRSG